MSLNIVIMKKNDPVLNAGLIKGLDLAKKLGNHFVKHDANEEHTRMFQHELKLLVVYTKNYITA